MTINFLLPGVATTPVGGVKVVLSYANKLVKEGHSVNILYPVKISMKQMLQPSLLTRISVAKKIITKRIKKKDTAASWFSLDPAVSELLVPGLMSKYIPDADVTFATAWQTANWLNDYPASKGKKMYLIQHFEDWSGTKEEVEATWKMPLYKIVIARWLKEYARSIDETAHIVNNGLDFDYLGITTPIEKRNPFKLMMMSHHLAWKGTTDGLNAVKSVKEKFPQLSLILFGVHAAPKDLPDWIEYHQNPKDIKKLYNDASIFLSPSWAEGWALPPAEAMQCGCAVIATEIGGHSDYGINGKDLLLAPVKDPAGFAQVIISLLENDRLRIQIAKSGNQTIQKYTWDAAYQNLKPHL